MIRSAQKSLYKNSSLRRHSGSFNLSGPAVTLGADPVDPSLYLVQFYTAAVIFVVSIRLRCAHARLYRYLTLRKVSTDYQYSMFSGTDDGRLRFCIDLSVVAFPRKGAVSTRPWCRNVVS